MDQGIYVIIDGSGSMSGVKHEVVKGINEFIKEQQDDVKVTGDDVRFSLTTFDDKVMEIFIKEDITLVNPVKVSDTYLGGSTALLDAIGRTLTRAESDAAQRNIVVIYTDGEENASREFTNDQVSDLIKRLSDTGNWQFIYLGAEFEDFTTESAFVAVAAASGGRMSGMNTSKSNVGGTWSAVAQTTNYHRHATAAQYDSLQSGERNVTDAAAEDAEVDWVDVVEPTK